MKKILISIITLLVVAPLLRVSAAVTYNVKTVEASITNDIMTVSGTTEHGVLAVAILVYDENEENLITMITTAVTESDTYTDTINIEDGNYVVKAANYDGGEYKVTKTIKGVTTTTTPATTVTTTVKANEIIPKTSDNIILYVGVLLAAILAFAGVYIFKNKKLNTK